MCGWPRHVPSVLRKHTNDRTTHLRTDGIGTKGKTWQRAHGCNPFVRRIWNASGCGGVVLTYSGYKDEPVVSSENVEPTPRGFLAPVVVMTRISSYQAIHVVMFRLIDPLFTKQDGSWLMRVLTVRTTCLLFFPNVITITLLKSLLRHEIIPCTPHRTSSESFTLVQTAKGGESPTFDSSLIGCHGIIRIADPSPHQQIQGLLDDCVSLIVSYCLTPQQQALFAIKVLGHTASRKDRRIQHEFSGFSNAPATFFVLSLEKRRGFH